MVEQLERFQRDVRRTAKSKIGRRFVEFIAEVCAKFGKKLFVVVDGIDESAEAKQLSYDTLDLATNSSVLFRVFVSSWRQTNIERVLSNRLRIHLTPDLVRNDLERHLNSCFDKDETLKIMKSDIKEKIKKELLKKHQGM
jgi:hypothetical protein